MSNTVGLIFVDENSPRYSEFVNTRKDLIALGAQHDPHTLTQFVLYLHMRCDRYPSLDGVAFLGSLIGCWNKFKSLDALSSYEKFYTTGSFND